MEASFSLESPALCSCKGLQKRFVQVKAKNLCVNIVTESKSTVGSDFIKINVF